MPIRPSNSIQAKAKSKEGQNNLQAKRKQGDYWNDETSSDPAEDEANADNADAPRVAQWVDEDALEDGFDKAESSQLTGNNLTSLEAGLSSLPMGTLRRAQKILKVKDISDASDSESESSEDDTRPKPEWSTKPRTDISKRKNKHAPIEITSKRPVTRRRTVVNVQSLQVRDPRFLPITGEFSSQKFNDNYQFLNESHKAELSTLRENLKRARKMLASSPRDTKHEREVEVGRLELALKKAESTVNKDRRDTIEQEALRAARREERTKQEAGKGKWYMKESEKKELLVRARYDAIAEQGGHRAVKKSIEKKRKKIAQKEKKSRPLANGTYLESRSFEHNSHDRHRQKRRKMD
ncbi:hypothetical protein GGU10DRAFT_302186 [Lentinula aff. detonsa]|uniref:rRNA biogenesis protein RRP36 n=1 Tax=Lentinula aff. detonsa TaxID=2804958 RepID=A0AA38NTN5_9AGAR|nr:hypothetical protein GGU10DRAFT_302186 [Lentinula aff. detonsa]